MTVAMTDTRTSCLAVAIVAGLIVTAAPARAADAVVEWNKHAAALAVLPTSRLAPVQQTRAMAIVQTAVHDTVNSITRRYATYLSHGPAPAGASPEAAAIAAAHRTLVDLFAGHAASLDALYFASLGSRGLSATDPGIAFGRAVAAAILAVRTTDGATDAQFDYVAPGAGRPGVWQQLTATPALLPGWGRVTPWVLRRGSQFRPAPPPSLRSARYARDYSEVKSVGAAIGSTRSIEQDDIALFWRASPTAIWNDVLNQVLATRTKDLSETARAFALFYLAAADASIACWDAKYAYNFWRPLPAIRSGDADGNRFTAGDAIWEPFLATPPHPEYPSGHTANSGAMAAIVALLYGDYPGTTLSVTMSGVTRHWRTLSEGVDEVIDARVYSGFHFRTADEVGARLGRRVARFVVTHALRPCRGRGARCQP